MGVMSGTLDLIQRAYLGGEIRGDTLYFDPKETERLDGLSLAMQFRGLRSVSLSGGELTVAAESHGVSRPVKVGLGDQVHELCPATASRSAPTRGGAAMATGFEVRSSTSTACSWTRPMSERGARPSGDDGGRLERRARPDSLLAREVHASGLPAGHVQCHAWRAHGRSSTTSRSPTPSRVEAYADRKRMVVELIEAGEFEAYPDALRFVLAVKNAGIPTAAASSSKNAGLFLRQIRLDTFAAEQSLDYDFISEGLSLLDFFDVDISGRDFPRGKPDPEIF